MWSMRRLPDYGCRTCHLNNIRVIGGLQVSHNRFPVDDDGEAMLLTNFAVRFNEGDTETRLDTWRHEQTNSRHT